MWFIITTLTLILFVVSDMIMVWGFNGQCNHHHVSWKEIYAYEHSNSQKIFNPSIVRQNNGGYLCCARQTRQNKKNILNGLVYRLYPKSSLVFFSITQEGRFQSVSQWNSQTILEDPRMISYNDKYIISVVEYYNSHFHFPSLYIFDINLKFNYKIDYNKQDYFSGQIPSTITEKNWCPFIHDDSLYVHTHAYPKWKVWQVDRNGRMNLVANHTPIFQLDEETIARCSTSWKEYDSNYYICGLHTKRIGIFPTIRNLLVLIDKETFKPTYQTKLLCFESPITSTHSKIQFLSGLEVDADSITVSYGVNDIKLGIRKTPRSRLKFFPVKVG